MAQPSELTEMQKQGRSAFGDFCSRGLVLLTVGTPQTPPAWIGSGTLLRSPKGRLLVLTAYHNLEDDLDSPFRLVSRLAGTVEDSFERYWRAPANDVGVALIRPFHHTALDKAAYEASVVAVGAEDTVGEADTCYLCGFPSRMVVPPQDQPLALLSSSITFGCEITGIDPKNRYKVRWSQAIPDASAGKLPLLKLKEGEVFSLPEPGGISGGALWRFPPTTPEAIWSPTGLGKLIGVASSWDQRDIEFAEPVSGWGDWFRGVLREIDEE